MAKKRTDFQETGIIEEVGFFRGEEKTKSPGRRPIIYTEPADYFPEEIRRQYKLGEFAEEEKKSE